MAVICDYSIFIPEKLFAENKFTDMLHNIEYNQYIQEMWLTQQKLMRILA